MIFVITWFKPLTILIDNPDVRIYDSVPYDAIAWQKENEEELICLS